MMAVFEVAARHGYTTARRIVKDLAAVPNIPLPKAWHFALRRLGPTELKDFLAPDEEEKWRQAIENRMGDANDRALPDAVVRSLLAEMLAESRSTTADANLRRWLRLLEE
jgi:hypothetical protein